ncbi:MAG: hypothetical protein KAR35_07960, partial [Candidatus Heimdallarchaeota archaeon]|nr:hypothetical protein [Candidatus Heimdallarchaeota archaeon]MCK5049294.1 hypothetical protein [Candidatus Heimdallarchaeota archaeon]
MDLRRKRNTFSSRGFALLLMIGMLLSTILSPSTNVSANQIEGIESSSPYNSYNEPVINSPDEGLFSSATDFLDGQVNAFLESERESNLKISSNLASYLETGEVPDNIVSVNDNPRIISVVISGSDVSDFVKVESTIALSGLSWIIGSVSKPADLVKMSEMPGVLSISGDIKIANEYSSTDLTKFQSEVKDLDPIYSPENYVIRDIIGVTDMVGLYSDVDGSDVVIQIHDTGVDFGQTDLVDAFARDESGIPTVLDSAGNGFSFTVATLPDVSGYIATSSLDPETTEFIVGDGYQYVPQNYNLTDLGFEFLVAQDYELPSTVSSVSGDYKFGFLGQSTDSGYISIFPYILVDSVTSGVYDTIFVDLDTGLYASMKWVDDEDNTLTTKYSSYLDYSFEDEDAHKWGDGTEIMARDLDADGINDVSAGTLSNGIDIYGVIDEGTFFSGIFSDGSG